MYARQSANDQSRPNGYCSGRSLDFYGQLEEKDAILQYVKCPYAPTNYSESTHQVVELAMHVNQFSQLIAWQKN